MRNIDGVAYGFVGWSGDATGWELISNAIIMDAPRDVGQNIIETLCLWNLEGIT